MKHGIEIGMAAGCGQRVGKGEFLEGGNEEISQGRVGGRRFGREGWRSADGQNYGIIGNGGGRK